MAKSFGAFNNWVGFMDVDEYFQPNASVADALASGAATLVRSQMSKRFRSIKI